MTHVNNAKASREMERVGEPEGGREREEEPAAGSEVQHRFLASGSNEAVDAAATAITCLEDFAFEACQSQAAASGWAQLHEEFCIVDDELEYDDELSLCSSHSASGVPGAGAAVPMESLTAGEHQNEQLLMEGG